MLELEPTEKSNEEKKALPHKNRKARQSKSVEKQTMAEFEEDDLEKQEMRANPFKSRMVRRRLPSRLKALETLRRLNRIVKKKKMSMPKYNPKLRTQE